jgi:hypothetical protein
MEREKVRIGHVPLSFLTVADGIAEAHHICQATRSRAARSNEAWKKTSWWFLPPHPPLHLPERVFGLHRRDVGIGRNETHNQQRMKQLECFPAMERRK